MSMVPNPQMTEEEMLMQLYAQQQAANQYGSGQSFMETDANPYTRPQSRINYWQDIEALTGVPFVQLSGVGSAPTDPANAPNIFQSDVGAAYRSNPVFADAFDLIDQGVDPYKAMAAVQQAYDAGEYGEQATMLVPQKIDEFTGQASIDWEEVGGTVQQYATDNARTQRETEQFQLQNSPAYSAVQKDGARYANAPLGGNDPFAWAQESELYDWDALQGDADTLKAQNRYAETLSASDKVSPSGARLGRSEYDPNEFRIGPGAPAATAPRPNLGQVTPMAQTARIRQQMNPNADHDSRQIPMKNPNAGQAKRAQKAQGQLATGASDAYDKSLQANINNRRDRASNTMVRSDANANAMARLKAAYALLLGQ